MKYSVKIKDPNKMFIINNKQVRSPLECVTNEDGLLLIKSRIKFYGISESKYEIEQIDVEEKPKEDYSFIPPKREPVKTSSPKRSYKKKTVSDKKQSKKEKLENEEKFNKKERPIFPDENDLPSNIQENTEQNINEETNIEGEEIKIEELSIKSSSILEKFMKSEF